MTGQGKMMKKRHLSELYTMIQSCDIGQRILYFDTCQLTITCTSNIKLDTYCVPYFLEYALARLFQMSAKRMDA